MTRLVENQSGSAFVQVLVAACLSGVLFGTLVRYVSEQSQAEALAEQKSLAHSLQKAMKVAFSDVNSCSCYFDGTSGLNGVRKDLKVDLQAVRDRQRSGVSGPSLPLRWLSKISMSPKELCDYGRATAVALPGELVADHNPLLRVERVEIQNIRMVNPLASQNTLHHLRGVLTVSFASKISAQEIKGRSLASDQVRPVSTEVNFYADSDGVTRTCDPQLQVQGLTLGNALVPQGY